MLSNTFSKINLAEVTGFQRLPQPCQIIIADCLEKGSPYIDLLTEDVNGDLLRRQGWLLETTSMMPGVRSYSIPYDKWRELNVAKRHILTQSILAEVVRQRALRPSLFGSSG